MKKLIPILLAVFALASCEKDPDMGKLDDNYLVYTNYDKKADFKVPTFYLAPQILVISDSKEPEYLEGEGAEQILAATDAAYVKELGRKVSNYNENVWNGLRQLIVYEGLLAKFSQNEEFRNRLLSTGDAILAECAVKDCIWGIGLSMTDPDRFNITSWRGQNLLGYTLMMVRDKLK